MTSWMRDIEDDDVQSELRRLLDAGQLMLFAGSGLSASATTEDGRHPPRSVELLRGMIDWCTRDERVTQEDQLELYRLLDAGFVIEAGQELEEALGELYIRQQCLQDIILSNHARPGRVHRLLAQLPFRAYLTTSYDRFLELAYVRERSVELPPYRETTIGLALEAFRRRQPFIWKLHGDVFDPGTIVLGIRSYERLQHTDSEYRSCLEKMLSETSALFVGFDLHDPDLEAITTRADTFDGSLERHWMLVPRHELPLLKAKRLLRDRGIKVITYSAATNGDDPVARFFERLAGGASLAASMPQDPSSKRSYETPRLRESPVHAVPRLPAPPPDERVTISLLLG